jgi:hypothetical protein
MQDKVYQGQTFKHQTNGNYTRCKKKLTLNF